MNNKGLSEQGVWATWKIIAVMGSLSIWLGTLMGIFMVNQHTISLFQDGR